jgi:TRAP-type mannitol/chloroaromatic compound transport system permease small subunit
MFSKLVDAVSETSARWVSYLYIPLTLVILFDVIMRYLFGSPTSWAFDAALHLNSIPFLIGGAWALKVGSHVRVDVLYNRFSPRVQHAINIFLYLFLLLPICYLLIKNGTGYALESWSAREVSRFTPLHPPIYPLKTLIPIAFVLLFLQGIVELIREIKGLLKGGRS